MIVRQISDADALDELAQWFVDEDPVLDGSHPDWIWDLVSLVEELLFDTGREGGHN